uniref:Uncharacterized protein n=1 Tax=Neobodo designis TaxID=312471 RepID=A0A7S1QVM9_NEODS|mmetsp:Transcript_52796/g.162528  ORF Transcript_52796/g.162528 Transcript_52796/m.162528 type:complete len:898 (+) Transcript_52796:26-2719(+)
MESESKTREADVGFDPRIPRSTSHSQRRSRSASGSEGGPSRSQPAPEAAPPPRSHSDLEKECAYLKAELAAATRDLKAAQQSAASYKASLDSANAAVSTLSANVQSMKSMNAEMERALADRSANEGQGREELSALTERLRQVVDSATATASSRSQCTLLRLEAAIRANLLLEHDLECSHLEAMEAKLRATVLETVVRTRAATHTVGITASELQESDQTGIAESATKRFEATLVSTCEMLEESAVEASTGDWRGVLARVTESAKRLATEHSQLLGRFAQLSKEVATSRSTNANLSAAVARVGEMVLQSTLVNPSLRAQIVQGRGSQGNGSPSRGVGQLDLLSQAALGASMSMGSSNEQETHLLRFALREANHDIARLRRALSDASEALKAAKQLNFSQFDDTSQDPFSPRSHNPQDGSRIPLLETICEQWARRAVVATHLLADSCLSTSPTSCGAEQMKAELLRLRNELEIERVEGQRLRDQVCASVGLVSFAASVLTGLAEPQALDRQPSTPESLSDVAASMRASFTGSEQQYVDTLQSMRMQASEHSAAVQQVCEAREVRHLRTINFLVEAVALADRATMACINRPIEAGNPPNPGRTLPIALNTLMKGAPTRSPEHSAPHGQKEEVSPASVIKAVEQLAARQLMALKSASRTEEERLRRRVTMLESLDSTTAAQRVLALEDENTQLQSRLQELETKISAVADQASKMDELRASLENEIATCGKQLVEANAAVESAVAEKRAAEAEMENARAKIAELETQPPSAAAAAAAPAAAAADPTGATEPSPDPSSSSTERGDVEETAQVTGEESELAGAEEGDAPLEVGAGDGESSPADDEEDGAAVLSPADNSAASVVEEDAEGSATRVSSASRHSSASISRTEARDAPQDASPFGSMFS